ncbi:MAG: 3-deoxy-D-manno-octulosonic-acid kinase [Planctomycetes bacterium ADurb.Bin126]|nr:MAG: 3-deoxy-D-manno-octulosonic-acid kinase [Planctomycetes bacterium ADurb.Bin126]HOD81880.1 lipopolysaccharide kinase InaA family protein [Phycisphaerae bacterium]HQL74593.1 lipopolysaccharide kinase InaA family protein [Phycisphaerae bacterium]
MTTDSHRQVSPGGKVRFADPSARALVEGHLGALCDPASAGWELVKQNPSRSVYRGRIGLQEVYVKHFHGRSLAHRLGRRLGISRALCELGFSQYLTSHGVSTPPALAAQADGQLEWYATRAVEQAEPGDAWHERLLAQGPSARAAIERATLALAQTVARMHGCGVLHHDLHCGNVLVRGQGPELELAITDLHRMQRKRRLSRRRRARNLAQLLHDRYESTTRTQRLRFLKHYLRLSGGPGTLRGWQLMIEDFARRHRRKQFAKRDRRVLDQNRYFAHLRLPGGWRGRAILASKWAPPGSYAAHLDFTRADWEEALADVDALLTGPGGEVVKDSPTSYVVRRRLTVAGRELDVFVKQPRRKKGWKILLDCVRSARPLRAFRMGHALLTRRIATAMPLVAIERRSGPLLHQSILITEAVDGTQLNHFLNLRLGGVRGGQGLDANERRRLGQIVLRELGILLQRLHDNDFAHRDLKTNNMIVRWDGQSSPQLVLIDLDGMTARRRLSLRRRFQGLMRLNVSLLECPAVTHAGRLRMLLGYLRRPGAGRINFKPYWRELERWSARKLRQQIRSRRRKQRAVRRPGP